MTAFGRVDGDEEFDGTGPGVALDLHVPAVATQLTGLRSAARAFAEQHGAVAPDDVAVAISEVCTNIVVHAYAGRQPGPIELSAAPAGGHVWFVVSDRGTGPSPRADSPGLGMGLPIIAQLADHFEIGAVDGGGTRIRLGFAREDAGHRTTG